MNCDGVGVGAGHKGPVYRAAIGAAGRAVWGSTRQGGSR
jgi:hypothetical protein